MPISGDLKTMNLLNVQGVPMSVELVGVFTPNAVSAAGYIRDAELYEALYEENVLPLRRYHFLIESLEERKKLYRMMVGFLIQDSDAKDGLSEEFSRNVDFVRPSRCLSAYLCYEKELIEFYPTISRGKIIYEDLANDLSHFNRLFPNTTFGQMSKILRGVSWVSPENWGAP
jgi:hypothetical protein